MSKYNKRYEYSFNDWVQDNFTEFLPDYVEVSTGDYGCQGGSLDSEEFERIDVIDYKEGENCIQFTFKLFVNANVSGEVGGFHEPNEPDNMFSVFCGIAVNDCIAIGHKQHNDIEWEFSSKGNYKIENLSGEYLD
ncbi:hypothetical protein PL75_00205 [Neisseria arctica]|uniref:Uncharacterized protein n=1 Tax=Neisseria arctica TaxID=1470200 RepID=A0A0J0YUN2_9NEIS|nr:hypothetical protein [Neisseria arctica]KLT73804.1 hypothetical protein PL75_00205 [Neisseria arctica]UOO87009.1 hypothetical protein LVJ86_01795 [Neisseria arctica]